MMMRKWTWVLLMAVVFSLGVGCGGDDESDDSPPPTGGSGGSRAGSPGSGSGGSGGGGMDVADLVENDKCVNRGELNLECPDVPPFGEDACSPRGACCHRSSNYAKEKRLGPNDPLVLEYRVNFSKTANHEYTISVPFLTNATTTRYQEELQSLIWRFELPRMNGEEISGMGKTTIGVGRYNCDGTYSFYGDTAAPTSRASATMPLDDCPTCDGNAARWRARQAMVKVDVTKHGVERYTPVFAGNPNRGFTITPFLDSTTHGLDWELINSGFMFTKMDMEGEANRDCIGARAGADWTHAGTYIVYTPLEPNAVDVINILAHNYTALVVFGVLPDGMKDRDYTMVDRCMPDGPDLMSPCQWQKLPDALCPLNDADRMLWGCHLGAKGNPNMEMGYPSDADIACTDTAPTVAQDPQMNITTKGQCCDPMGMSTTLPACNSYRLVQDFVAAAAEIDDNLADEVQQFCRDVAM